MAWVRQQIARDCAVTFKITRPSEHGVQWNFRFPALAGVVSRISALEHSVRYDRSCRPNGGRHVLNAGNAANQQQPVVLNRLPSQTDIIGIRSSSLRITPIRRTPVASCLLVRNGEGIGHRLERLAKAVMIPASADDGEHTPEFGPPDAIFGFERGMRLSGDEFAECGRIRMTSALTGASGDRTTLPVSPSDCVAGMLDGTWEAPGGQAHRSSSRAAW